MSGDNTVNGGNPPDPIPNDRDTDRDQRDLNDKDKDSSHDQLPQSTQPMQLDRASLDAIISGVSAKIMSQSSPGGGTIVPPVHRQAERQRQPGDALAGDIPGENSLQAAGVQVFTQQQNNQQNVVTSQMLAASFMNNGGKDDPVLPLNLPVSPGAGLPALPKKMIERILANEYIDFTELPPAKGKVRTLPAGLEGQVVLIQAADLTQSKKLIPDLATWMQCFALYVAVLAPHQPSRIPDLLAYMSCIAKASQKYSWPSWLVYDQNFRQEAASNPHQPWSRVDPSIYAQSFTGQGIHTDNWCSRCHSLDHTYQQCPLAPRKRSYSSREGRPVGETKICDYYNDNRGNCRFGKSCCYSHICRSCKGPHSESRCKKASSGQMPAAGSH